MTPSDLATVTHVAEQFRLGGAVTSVAVFSGGHINRSYLVATDAPGDSKRFLVQAVNTAVFKSPFAVMDNIERVTSHLRGRLLRDGATDVSRRVLELVKTQAGPVWHHDASGFWRCYRFVERTRAELSASTPEQAFTAGHAFGNFLRQLDDFPPPPLHETIPRFHDTPNRVAEFTKSVLANAAGRASGSRREIDALQRMSVYADALGVPLHYGVIPWRVVHNDAKLSNVLLDADSGEAICVTDFDTVMPGTALYDFGDMVRSMSSRAAEDATDTASIDIDPRLFEALAAGYIKGARGSLTNAEKGLLTLSGIVITFEQAIRFLTDHLDGDRYYGAARPNHNLERARSQIAVLEALIKRRDALERIVADLA
ncbi:MAG: hypothetical protein RIS21_99 [Planctomycetota bacterium]